MTSDAKSKATNIIRAEHRALGAVINNIKAMLIEVQAQRMKMDFPLFWAMVYYIDAFPDRLHHPKEDDWLFSRLKQEEVPYQEFVTQLHGWYAKDRTLSTQRELLALLSDL